MEKIAYKIAIDGPVASGKGTIAPSLAEKLNGFYLPTGSMYRSLALACLDANVDIDEESEVIKILNEIEIDFRDNMVFLNGQNVTEKIKEEKVSIGSSNVSTLPSIRGEMIKRQQAVAQEFIDKRMSVVAEGRDTGTRLFPDADIKIYLTATPEIRAKRRLGQLQGSGRETNFEQVLSNITKRDEQDMNRKMDPLVRDPLNNGYVLIDNSGQVEEETIESIIIEMRGKNLKI